MQRLIASVGVLTVLLLSPAPASAYDKADCDGAYSQAQTANGLAGENYDAATAAYGTTTNNRNTAQANLNASLAKLTAQEQANVQGYINLASSKLGVASTDLQVAAGYENLFDSDIASGTNWYGMGQWNACFSDYSDAINQAGNFSEASTEAVDACNLAQGFINQANNLLADYLGK